MWRWEVILVLDILSINCLLDMKIKLSKKQLKNDSEV